MGITYTGFQTEAWVYDSPPIASSVLNPAYPPNIAGQIMTAWINVKDQNLPISGDVTVTPPAGWTFVNGSPGTGGVVNAVYYKLGDGSSGSMTWGFNKPVRGHVDIIVHQEINTSAPINASSFRINSSTSTPTANAIVTTNTNCMLICGWFESGTCYHFSTEDFTEILVDITGTTGSAVRPLLIANAIQAAAGNSGSKTATSYCLESIHPSNASAVLIAFASAPNPSIPVLMFPNGGEQLTVGASVNITWNPSTSPSAAQSTLKYNLDYSTNNGGSWTQIVALTTAGVTSYAWTVPNVIGSGNLIRIRSNDPALAIYSLGYDQSNAAFSIVAETAPGQPVITAPTSGSTQNKAVNITVAWMHQGGAGNPQTEFTLQWDDNAAFSSPTTVGPTVTATQSTSIDFSSLASGTTIYVKVKTKGISLYSAYSNVISFIVASVPATPNITAPIAASPPTVPQPTITFTEADTFISRKMRVTVGGIETYNSGEVASTALSFTSGYNFANGVQVVFFLSVKNTYGLWSAEDSETVTPSYSGPAVPTIGVQAVNEAGYVQIQITNSDSPVYNELWRFEYTAGRSSAIKVGMLLPADATFSDRNVSSGVVYQYFARAYNGTGLFTDSADSSVVSLNLDTNYLHIVSRTSTASNGTNSIAFILNEGSEFGFEEVAVSHKILNRAKPVGVTGQAVWQVARIVGTTSNLTVLAALMTIWRARSLVCLRTYAGHRIFGKMTEPPQSSTSVNNVNLESFSFTVTEEDYSEGL